METKTAAIVPVVLSEDRSSRNNKPQHSNTLACRLKLKELEISLYNQADSRVLKAVMEAMAKYAG